MIDHAFIRPGQVAAERPAPDACMRCGHPEAEHTWPPLETEKQARGLPEVRAAWAAFDANPGAGRMAPHLARMLTDACEAAGVTLGAYDQRIVTWLGGWEPATCAVFAGLIRRAYAAGRDGAI